MTQGSAVEIAETDAAARLKAMKERERKLEEKQSRTETRYFLFLALAMTCLILGAGLFVGQILGGPLSNPEYRLGSLFCIVSGGVLISFVPIWKAQLRVVQGQLDDFEFEREIVEYSPSKEETRADKLLRMNQSQLRRYHEMNLQQTMWVFFIGVSCIVVGVAIIGITLYLVRAIPATEYHEKILVAVVGAIGGILTNFIAAIYLQMHSAATKNLNQFHSTLVTTQQLFLANLIASRIEPNDKRWDALAKISMSMIAGKDLKPD